MAGCFYSMERQRSVGRSMARRRSNKAHFRFTVPAGTTLYLRNVALGPLGLNPIFNGKDLTGWKEFKGAKYKSQFNVTPEGWIHIKDGPGDLQTEEQWDDFVLQIDCR